MSPLHAVTPYWPHRGLPATGRETWLKMEAYQPTGSFKIRGVGRLCQVLQAEGATRFVSSSGGNAGYAAAYAGRALGVPTTVVTPVSTPQPMRDKIAALGATVRVEGAVWDEADAYARSLLADGAAYVHPFDDPRLWAGHATLVDEMLDQGPAPDAVVVAVGGGGLMCGVAEGLARHGLHETPILAVETDGAASFAAALAADALVTLPAITTIAGTLGAKRVAARALDWARARPIRAVTVSDADAVRAVARFADDHQCLVEPACGAALSLAYDDHPALAPFRRVVVIACGGVGISLEQLAGWRDQFGV